MTVKGQSAGKKWLEDNVSYSADACLLWPFSINSGYGQFNVYGKGIKAHRYMCELVNGPAPSPQHDAAHSCGNRRCVSPRHISWKTKTENQLDRRLHGTKANGKRGKLTYEQRLEIRSLRGSVTQLELAQRYGVTRQCISNIMTEELRPRARGAVREGRRWLARIRVNNQDYRLGKFDDLKDAQDAYRKAEARVIAGLHPIADAS